MICLKDENDNIIVEFEVGLTQKSNNIEYTEALDLWKDRDDLHFEDEGGNRLDPFTLIPENKGKVRNSWGREIDFEVATQAMDDELREELNMEIAPCSDQKFFDAYAKRHEEKFGEEWILDGYNPVY